ncbi:MAG: hypothetical protein ABS17_04285 [SAR86 cluster bacterium BACL1 MAG-120924-bin88]|nr:MAG: hypothetical protein ABS17_04285 [SAR86 cluster bacterium BACL1 MAG-120924-bin88]
MDKQILIDALPLIESGQKVELSYTIKNTDRTVGSRLSSRLVTNFKNKSFPENHIKIKLRGSAGQSLGAFGVKGLKFEVIGDCNDYVGKGLSGATISVRPPVASDLISNENTIVGNTVLYGATSGYLFAAGQAGERFSVRNSGATAVVEGAGTNACEYMTGGCSVILGEVGDNFAAGMTGGMAFIYDPKDNLEFTLKDLASERGVYLELPSFDLEDQNFLQQTNILLSPKQYIAEKFYNDAVLSIEISRVGINQWLVGGDLNSASLLQDDEIVGVLTKELQLFLDNFIAVEPLAPGASGDEILLSIKGLDSFEDFLVVEEELAKIFAIKSKAFHSFDRSQIEYKAQLFQTTASLLKELRGNSKLLFKQLNQEEQTLYLEYLN